MTCSRPARSSRSGSCATTSPARCAPTAWPPCIGGVLNSFPYTCFAENVGLVRLTRVKSRYVVAAAGVIMIIIGLIPKAGGDRGRHPAPGARRRRPGDVRHRRGRRHPDPVPGGLPRPPQRGHRRHQPRPGDVRDRPARRGQGGAGVGADHLRQRHHPGQHHRDPAQPGVPPRRQEPRPGGGRHARRRPGPARPGQRDVARGVREHLRPGCSRARTGWSSGPTTSARSATPTTCGASFQEALFAASPRGAGPAHQLLPRPRARRRWPSASEGEASQSDQSALGSDPARRRGARGARRR